MTTTTARSLRDQAHAINTLIALLGAFPDLPAVTVQVQRSNVIGDLRIHVYSGPADFELWREALRLDSDTADLRDHDDFVALETEGDWLGARVVLVGYVDKPTRQDARTDTTPAAVAA